MKSSRLFRAGVRTGWALAFLLATTSAAVQPPGEAEAGESLAEGFVAGDELQVDPALEMHPSGARAAELPSGMSSFLREFSSQWEVRWDRRGDRPHLIQGAGVPLIPGRGNDLVGEEIGWTGGRGLEATGIEPLLRDFMERFPELFRIAPEELVLDRDASVALAGDPTTWFIEFRQVHEGVPVRGANVFFRINHGNIVQFGCDRIADVRIPVAPLLDRRQALAAGLAAIGFKGPRIAETLDAGTLAIYPSSTSGEGRGEAFSGAEGSGYEHRLVWEFGFRRADDPGSYELVVDAVDGHVLRFLDRNTYADAMVSGGIYPVTNTDSEVVRPFAFSAVTNNGTKTTNAAGIYTYDGGTATDTLNGQFFRIADSCGAISLSNTTAGNLNFGTSGGTDCTTPGFGGAGNTHAARTAFYHLTNINRKAATYLPGNSWLSSKVTVNTSINQTCNAYWNGSTLNFYRSGGGCSNTGEIASVFLHEWGHGMDSNSGGSAPGDQGSGEAVGDTFAFLETHDGCIGQNFQLGVNCRNCTNCTGVRDVSDFAVSGGATVVASPSNITNNAGIDCDRFSCPFTGYQGPMGYQGHCESVIAGSANWDLAQNLVAAYGSTAGWAAMDAIWYGSLTPAKSAYQVVSGGQCNAGATVNGCGATNWYTVYLAADDDNGNLADGTPNSCRIWDAFDAHGIACGARPACSGGGGPPPPPHCTLGSFNGTLRATGDSDELPSAAGFTASAGTHSASLTGPLGANFNLFLEKKSLLWTTVASSQGVTSSESLTYVGTAGTYRWAVSSKSGSGSYNLCANRP